MCTGWCPLSADWGNWADWANLIVAAAVGIAVWRVSVRTADLAEASNRTNANLEKLERQRDSEAIRIQEQEQKLILVTLAISLARAFSALRATKQLLDEPDTVESVVNKPEIREVIANAIKRGHFTIPDSTRARMHFLKYDVAAKIVRVETSLPVLSTAIEGIGKLSDRVRRSNVANVQAGINQGMNDLLPVLKACESACHEAGINFQAPQNLD